MGFDLVYDTIGGKSLDDSMVAARPYYFDADQWTSEFQRLGMRVLVNEHLILTKGADQLVIAGVTDEAAAAFGHQGPDLSQALAGAPQNAPTILLKHRPVGASNSAAAGVDLQLSPRRHRQRLPPERGYGQQRDWQVQKE